MQRPVFVKINYRFLVDSGSFRQVHGFAAAFEFVDFATAFTFTRFVALSYNCQFKTAVITDKFLSFFQFKAFLV